MSGFKEVLPGVVVNDKMKVLMPHPDPCWVIHDPELTSTRVGGNGDLLIFSDEKKAEKLMDGNDKKSYVVKKYS